MASVVRASNCFTVTRKVCTFRAFPAWKCNVAFMQSPYEGRVAETWLNPFAVTCFVGLHIPHEESLAVELANSCKGTVAPYSGVTVPGNAHLRSTKYR